MTMMTPMVRAADRFYHRIMIGCTWMSLSERFIRVYCSSSTDTSSSEGSDSAVSSSDSEDEAVAAGSGSDSENSSSDSDDSNPFSSKSDSK